jgi:hypothetical protein
LGLVSPESGSGLEVIQDPDPSLKSGANEMINISKILYNRGAKNNICYSIIA